MRNAVDATLETGGQVWIDWTKLDGYLQLTVEDEGPGLPDTTNLFVPFFTTKPSGSGIGLALSRQIAEAHGGTLGLENRPGAKGCRGDRADSRCQGRVLSSPDAIERNGRGTGHREKLFAAASRILPGGVDSPGARVQGGRRHAALHRARERRAHRRRRRQHLHRLRDVVGTADPRPRAARAAEGARPPRRRAARASARRRSSRRGSAQRVATLMPSMERVRFVSSGTEAAMSAIRVARAATKRDRIIKFEGCYHGHADAFLVQAGSGALTLGVPTSPGVPAAAAADTLLARYNDLASVEAVLERASPTRSPPSSSSRSPATWAWCRRATASSRACASSAIAHGVLLVFDEVISGFRAAAGGAQQVFRVQPGPDLPRQDHRRRPAGRRLRRPRRPDGAGRAGGSGVSGRHAVGQSAGDDGRPVVADRAVAEALSRTWRSSARSSRPGSPTRRATAGVPMQVNAFGSLVTPFFTSEPVRDLQSAMQADTAATGSSSAGCWRAASIRRRRSSRRGSCRARTPRRMSTKTMKAARAA